MFKFNEVVSRKVSDNGQIVYKVMQTETGFPEGNENWQVKVDGQEHNFGTNEAEAEKFFQAV